MSIWRKLTKQRSSEEPYVPDQFTIWREVEMEQVVSKAQIVFAVWPAPDASGWTADQIVHACGGLVTRGYVDDLLRGHSEDDKLTKWIAASVLGYPLGPISSREMSVWDRPMWWWRMVRDRQNTFPDPSKLRQLYTRAYVAWHDLQDLIEHPARKARPLYPTVAPPNETPEWYTVETLHPLWVCAILQISPLDLAWLADPLFNPRPEITQVGNSSGQLQPANLPEPLDDLTFLKRHGNITTEHGLDEELSEQLAADVLNFRVRREEVVRLMTPPNVDMEREVNRRIEAVGSPLPDGLISPYFHTTHPTEKEGGS